MGMELYQTLSDKERELTASIKLLRKNGNKLAEAQRDYNVALAEASLKLRSQEMPVGMIQLVVKGIKSVADKRFERDAAQVMYDANKDHINATKLEMRILEAQIEREYGQAGSMT